MKFEIRQFTNLMTRSKETLIGKTLQDCKIIVCLILYNSAAQTVKLINDKPIWTLNYRSGFK